MVPQVFDGELGTSIAEEEGDLAQPGRHRPIVGAARSSKRSIGIGTVLRKQLRKSDIKIGEREVSSDPWEGKRRPALAPHEAGRVTVSSISFSFFKHRDRDMA